MCPSSLYTILLLDMMLHIEEKGLFVPWQLYFKNCKRKWMPIEMMIPIKTDNENGTYWGNET